MNVARAMQRVHSRDNASICRRGRTVARHGGPYVARFSDADPRGTGRLVRRSAMARIGVVRSYFRSWVRHARRIRALYTAHPSSALRTKLERHRPATLAGQNDGRGGKATGLNSEDPKHAFPVTASASTSRAASTTKGPRATSGAVSDPFPTALRASSALLSCVFEPESYGHASGHPFHKQLVLQ